MTASPISRSTLYAAALALTAGCGAQADTSYGDLPDELDHGDIEVRPLAGQRLYADTALGMATRVAVHEDKLLLIDALGDSAIHVVSRADGRRLQLFGRRGQGPGEFDAAWSLDPIAGEPDAFWVYDSALRRLTQVQLGTEGGVAVAERDVFINLHAEATILDPLWIDGRLIAAGFFQNGRLGCFDEKGELVQTMGPVPEAPGNFPPAVRQQAYQATLQPNPSRTRLAIATRHSDQLEIYRADGGLVRRVYGPFRFEPDFGMHERAGRVSMSAGERMRFGYIDLAATEEWIYVLFSGRTSVAFGPDAPFGEYIHVYDWDGEFHGVLKLGAPALVIAVDPDGKDLYTAIEDPYPEIRVYSLAPNGDAAYQEPDR